MKLNEALKSANQHFNSATSANRQLGILVWYFHIVD